MKTAANFLLLLGYAIMIGLVGSGVALLLVALVLIVPVFVAW